MSQDPAGTPTKAGGAVLRWLVLPLVMVVVALGVWVTGGVITNDEAVAKGLTLVWFVVSGALVALVAYRYRSTAAPALIGYAVATVGLGGFLLYTSTVDRVVDEDVVVAATPDASSQTGDEPEPSASEGENEEADTNVLVSRGRFVDGEHPTDGVASIIATDDKTFVTLTSFETDPGPDLRVYFVAHGEDPTSGEDLGALKGNKGDQQYVVPAQLSQQQLRSGSVVIWCRAFSVAFGTARLATQQ
ncbi:MAG TPA: DM13 domain-containing protein [Actinomycetes bacterium]|nr:DM13 domain-containing protein [Actinomycetes bacterium]